MTNGGFFTYCDCSVETIYGLKMKDLNTPLLLPPYISLIPLRHHIIEGGISRQG